ncbi:hypothetical protein, partial [Micromonospora sediminicola]|uniref:hypothetical protein n=1 Tax=Micromonospora sediminicola TaxID=946078 RepID=UPI00379438DF
MPAALRVVAVRRGRGGIAPSTTRPPAMRIDRALLPVTGHVATNVKCTQVWSGKLSGNRSFPEQDR